MDGSHCPRPPPLCAHGLHSLPITAPGLSPLGSVQGYEVSFPQGATTHKTQEPGSSPSWGSWLQVDSHTFLQASDFLHKAIPQGSQGKSSRLSLPLAITGPPILTTPQPLGRTERASGCATPFSFCSSFMSVPPASLSYSHTLPLSRTVDRHDSLQLSLFFFAVLCLLTAFFFFCLFHSFLQLARSLPPTASDPQWHMVVLAECLSGGLSRRKLLQENRQNKM